MLDAYPTRVVAWSSNNRSYVILELKLAKPLTGIQHTSNLKQQCHHKATSAFTYQSITQLYHKSLFLASHTSSTCLSCKVTSNKIFCLIVKELKTHGFSLINNRMVTFESHSSIIWSRYISYKTSHNVEFPKPSSFSSGFIV